MYIHTHIYLDRREALCPINIYLTLIKNVDKLKFRVIYQVFLISKDMKSLRKWKSYQIGLKNSRHKIICLSVYVAV